MVTTSIERLEVRIADTKTGRQFCWIPGADSIRVVEKQTDGSFKETSKFQLDPERSGVRSDDTDDIGRVIHRMMARILLP